MARFILDCSMTMSWFFEDEATPQTDDVRNLLLTDSQDLVPSISMMKHYKDLSGIYCHWQESRNLPPTMRLI